MGRTEGALNQSTKNAERYIDATEWNQPRKRLRKNEEWKESDCLDEMKFLIKFVNNEDPKKLWESQCLRLRDYQIPDLYKKIAKLYPESCGELYEYYKLIRREKLATGALTKDYDSRFSVFAMGNISEWRQNQQIDVAATIKINTKDYKGVQPEISKRIENKKKGS